MYPDYDAEMTLPPGKTCSDCVHLRRCMRVLGCTSPERTSCDFYPNRFRQRPVLTGLLADPNNWFMSDVNDPTTFDLGGEA